MAKIGTNDIISSKRRRLLWGNKKCEEPEDDELPKAAIFQFEPPFSYSTSYASSWKSIQDSKSTQEDILDLLYLKEVRWLVGCTSTGHVVAWKLQKNNDPSLDEEEIGSSNRWERNPTLRQMVASCPLKSLAAYPGDSSKVLVVGDQGAWILQLEESSCRGEEDASTTKTVGINPLRTILRCGIEQVISSASGFCVRGSSGQVEHHHQVDGATEKAVEIFLPKEMKASSMVIVPDSEAPDIELLLIGTTSGQLLVYSLSKEVAAFKDGPEVVDLCRIPPESNGLPFNIDVKTICEHSQGQWWTVAGNSLDANKQNLIATIYAPTRTLICHQQIRQSIQSMLACPSTHRVFSAANEAVITVWAAPYRLDMDSRHRVWASMPSAKAICHIDADPLSTPTIAVAGVGNKVDILQGDCRTQCLTSV